MTDAPTLYEPRMQPGRALLDAGRQVARDHRLGSCLFLQTESVPSEAEYKRRTAAEGRIMQHAHIGFRSIDRTVDAMARLHDMAQAQGARIDRFGITLDWSMGYPPEQRDAAGRGTGIVLSGPEDFARITNACPAAAHFGDFMLGLPGALHNTKAAIDAGATAIGNLGQYFTFRLPYWDDDVATTEATVTALGLIAAQDSEILVHSNLDDGFAGLFLDVTSAFGMMLIEKHIVEDLIGARASFCFGHHFSSPLTRAAFHAALAREGAAPGTMLFGNTVAYQGLPAANYASLASYLLADMVALSRTNTGHAINPVPVTENLRIPDVEEILDAQIFAHRLAQHTPAYVDLIDPERVDSLASRIADHGRLFAHAALTGLAELGVDVSDPAALMLAIKRLGAKRMEAAWGQGAFVEQRRQPLVPADWAEELDDMARDWLLSPEARSTSCDGLKVVIGTTDVHEHGAYLISRALAGLSATVTEAGVALDPDALVARACDVSADVIAISTYNGIALSYTRAVLSELEKRGLSIPVLVGGKLNEIPETSNTDLPVDVTAEIRAIGAEPCHDLEEMAKALRHRCQRVSALSQSGR
ncbi:cobalamin-dependent protein [Roseovarius indicus]|uniref:Methylaspartate mutase subunit S n=1 Tax=Roseovarius indicus TaxID=540747 RepID=A0A5P3AB94_9RHOB|nr:cobalamin-dependent protein [Roseovarius indicus]QEW25628.1 methylaspartate mutase subunit S [Roseovarius indicus]SFE01590.1 methylmalonyl-CoA mutase C-terminal domain-containing protein [Roseovarius indicus]